MIQTSSRSVSYRRYYAKGETLININMQIIKTITAYVLAQHDPQVTKEAVDVIQAISTSKSGEEVLRYVISYNNMNNQLENFLISTITKAYN